MNALDQSALSQMWSFYKCGGETKCKWIRLYPPGVDLRLFRTQEGNYSGLRYWTTSPWKPAVLLCCQSTRSQKQTEPASQSDPTPAQHSFNTSVPHSAVHLPFPADGFNLGVSGGVRKTDLVKQRLRPKVGFSLYLVYLHTCGISLNTDLGQDVPVRWKWGFPFNRRSWLEWDDTMSISCPLVWKCPLLPSLPPAWVICRRHQVTATLYLQASSPRLLPTGGCRSQSARQRLDRSGRGEINEAGGRANTPRLRGGWAGRLLSSVHLEGFVWLLPSEDLTLPLDFGVLLIWLACSDRGQGIAGIRSQSAAGCQETSFIVASEMSRLLPSVSCGSNLQHPRRTPQGTLFFSPILHPPRGRVNHWGSDRCRSSGAAFCRVCCICLSCIWCTPSTTSWGVDFLAWIWPCVLAGSLLHT